MKVITWCGIIVSLMVFSCNTLFDNGFDTNKLEKERAAWEAQGIRHYRYATEFSGGDGTNASVEITVFPDREPEMVEIYSNYPGDSPHYGKTIDEFYQYLKERAADSQWNQYFSIRYNKQYHYPEYYSSNVKYPWVGGGVEIEITEFEPLGE
jgi:hypothetical protein